MLCRESGLEVAGEAAMGLEAISLTKMLKPDLILMNPESALPEILETIEKIMSVRATPILLIGVGANSEKSYEAIQRGAIDVVTLPDANAESADKFLKKIRLTASLPVISHIRPSSSISAVSGVRQENGNKGSERSFVSTPISVSSPRRVFAIASSTGGPQVLSLILPRLPVGFPCPVLIAQHIADGFAEGMARWLSDICSLTVRLATPGEEIIPGVIYIAPSESHCVLMASRRIALVRRSNNDIYRPSCDRLLASVADVCLSDAVGIILTGMGDDGAKGITRIRQNGGLTIAQDKESSLIYGMNRCAIEAGVVQKVLPASLIAAEMSNLAGGKL